MSFCFKWLIQLQHDTDSEKNCICGVLFSPWRRRRQINRKEAKNNLRMSAESIQKWNRLWKKSSLSGRYLQCVNITCDTQDRPAGAILTAAAMFQLRHVNWLHFHIPNFFPFCSKICWIQENTFKQRHIFLNDKILHRKLWEIWNGFTDRIVSTKFSAKSIKIPEKCVVKYIFLKFSLNFLNMLAFSVLNLW